MKSAPKNKNTSSALRRLLPFAVLTAALLALLVACSNDAVSPPAAALPQPAAPAAPQPAQHHDAILFRGPFNSPPLELGYIPEGELRPWIQPMAIGDEVEMKALLISATNNAGEIEPSTGAWIAVLEQTGTPYDWFIASENTLTMDDLVRPDGVGKYQAILLSTSNLVYDAGGTYPSALDSGEWQTLFNYEHAYGVRQAALYAAPYDAPEPMGVDDYGDGAVYLDGVQVTPTAAGLGVFSDLDPDSVVELYGTHGFLGRNPSAGTTPLLMSGDDILAIHIDTAGRERVAMLYNNPAWGASNTPAIYAQQIGTSLLRWAMRGIHIGERRASYQADVDDWFNSTGIWNLDLGQDDPVEEFEMSAQDAASVVAQQQALRQIGGGIADHFRWSMAYNGQPADTTSVVDCALPAEQHTLSSMTRCLADEFWWVNHTWSHAYMDWNPPHVGLSTAQIVEEISGADDVSEAFGFGANDSVHSLVTGDISGLGWYAPGGPDTGPKVDNGLEDSSPNLLEALGITGRQYLASNMSTPSHEPDCWGCGLVHPMNSAVFLVPRWPTNLFATVAEPAHVVQAYNQIYGPGGSNPIPGVQDPLTYEQILDIDTDIALVHLLAGSPYPHYFHISNFYEYAPGHSLLFDWTSELFAKYASKANEPLLSYMNDDFGDYIRTRTEFLENDVTGVWDRVTGQITLTSASGGPVFLTGASLGAGSTTFEYNGRLISQRDFSPGESVVINVNGEPPADPAIASFSATPTTVAAGTSTTLSWVVTGDVDNITLRVAGGADVETGLSAVGSQVVTPTVTTTYELVASAAGMTDIVAPVTVEVVTAPTVVLTVNPTSITAGQTATLSWTVAGTASNIALNQLGDPGTEIGTGLAATGTQAVTPTADATYQLAATWLGGTVLSDPVAVTVTPAPVQPAATFTATPDAIVAGESTTLTWAITGDATNSYIRIQGSEDTLFPALAATGSQAVSPTSTTTYELVMEWTGTPVVQSATVTVTPAPVEPSATFTANPDTIVAGESTTLTWAIAGDATNSYIRIQGSEDPLFSDLETEGDQSVSPTVDTTYELVMEWAGTPVTVTATVTVAPAPVEPTITLTAAPQSITVGDSSLISWSVTGSVTNTLLRVKGGANVATDLAANGSRSVSPSATTTYELVAAWAGDAVVSEVMVTVTPLPDPEPEPEPEPTMHEVTIRLMGDGFGIVVSSPTGLVCLDECSAEFPEGTDLTLVPITLLGSSFSGFTGACEGPTCSITVDRPLEVGATFGFED